MRRRKVDCHMAGKEETKRRRTNYTRSLQGRLDTKKRNILSVWTTSCGGRCYSEIKHRLVNRLKFPTILSKNEQ